MRGTGRAFRGGKAFIGYVAGGDPSIEKTGEFVLEMAGAGADLVEIGVPFSDPVAEGPVIQEASIRALRAGATPEKLLALAERLRGKTDVPLALMAYANTVFRRGFGAFFDRAAGAGIDGVIIPDMPFEEQAPAREEAARRGIDLISLVAPTTSASSAGRLRKIAKSASGFVYVVSSMGVTGVRGEMGGGLGATIAELRRETGAPLAVGFGIHSPEQAASVARIADGVIVGSAIVKIAAELGDAAGPAIFEYVAKMKAALRLAAPPPPAEGPPAG